MRNWIYLITILGFFDTASAAFDRQYEYRSFSENEMEIPDYYDKIDSEYSSDILTYSISPEDEVRFQTKDKILIATFGSLSRREFMKDSRLKIKQKLSEKFDFKYNYIEQEDFENSQTHSIFELVYKISEKFHVSSFADLDFAKVNDNVGFSFSYLPKLNHEIKFFYNMVQYDRNKRNPGDDKFNKKPYAYGFVGRYTKEKYSSLKYFEYGFVNETEAEWIFPALDYTYNYRRWMGTLRYMNPVSENEAWSFFYQIDHRRDQKDQISVATPLNGLDVKRNQFQVNYSKKDFSKFELASGAYIVYRGARVPAGEWTYYDVIPYATLHFNKDQDASGFWSLGYDVDIHHEQKKEALTKDKTKLEHRANVFWTARFNSTASLKFAATLDVDDISWEGGNGQFAMEF